LNDIRKPDPQADAERMLRLALAAEARAEQKLRRRIQIGAYGLLALIVVAFLAVLYFSF
jgi:hypothetical protein